MTAPGRTLPGRVLPRRLMECLALAQLWCAAAFIEVALRRHPFADLAARWTRAAASPLGRRLPLGSARLPTQRLDRLADLAAGWWRSGRECLPRTLLRWWIAIGADPAVDAVLVIGVRRDASRPFSAHAWLVIDGRVRGERRDPAVTFQELVRYDRDGRTVPAGAAGGGP